MHPSEFGSAPGLARPSLDSNSSDYSSESGWDRNDATSNHVVLVIPPNDRHARV